MAYLAVYLVPNRMMLSMILFSDSELCNCLIGATEHILPGDIYYHNKDFLRSIDVFNLGKALGNDFSPIFTLVQK